MDLGMDKRRLYEFQSLLPQPQHLGFVISKQPALLRRLPMLGHYRAFIHPFKP